MEDQGELIYDLALLYFKLKDYSNSERVISLAITDHDGIFIILNI